MINYKVNDNNKYLPAEGGTLSGDLNMSGRLIKNVASPVDDSDSITKKYVEENFATQEDFSAIGILLSLNNIVLLKVVNCNGVPAYGLVVKNMKDPNGKDVIVDEDGLANGICTGNSVILSTPGIDDITYNVSSLKGSSKRTLITLPSIEGKIIEYSKSTTLTFSKIVKTVDVCCVGGGGGGCRVDNSVAGAGGGNLTNKYSISLTYNKSYSLVVGAAGTGMDPGNSGTQTGGGTSSFLECVASGGGAGTLYPTSLPNNSINGGVGGALLYNGGYKRYGGSPSTATRFDDGVTYYSGGGAVGYNSYYFGSTQDVNSNSAHGGSPYGGDPGDKGKGYGGGGSSYADRNGGGYDGYQGVVFVRFHDATL